MGPPEGLIRHWLHPFNGFFSTTTWVSRYRPPKSGILSLHLSVPVPVLKPFVVTWRPTTASWPSNPLNPCRLTPLCRLLPTTVQVYKLYLLNYLLTKTSLDLNQARDDGVLGWQWHQLDHMQPISTWLRTNNHTNSSSLIVFTGRMLFLTPNQQCQSTEDKQTTAPSVQLIN